jgi:mannose-1-phosphate guanylyltransferase
MINWVKQAYIEKLWGRTYSVSKSDEFEIRKIEIHPKQKRFTHFQENKSEVWMVVSGSAIAMINENRVFLGEGDILPIPEGSLNYIENPFGKILIIIEVIANVNTKNCEIVEMLKEYNVAK